MRFRFWKQIGTGLSALNAVTDILQSTDLGSANELTYYIVFGPGTSAGAVQIESAHADDYAGTWAKEGPQIVHVSANRVHKINIQGFSFASRARISDAIIGGSVDVYVGANG